jgi:hypothetical protein
VLVETVADMSGKGASPGRGDQAALLEYSEQILIALEGAG